MHSSSSGHLQFACSDHQGSGAGGRRLIEEIAQGAGQMARIIRSSDGIEKAEECRLDPGAGFEAVRGAPADCGWPRRADSAGPGDPINEIQRRTGVRVRAERGQPGSQNRSSSRAADPEDRITGRSAGRGWSGPGFSHGPASIRHRSNAVGRAAARRDQAVVRIRAGELGLWAIVPLCSRTAGAGQGKPTVVAGTATFGRWSFEDSDLGSTGPRGRGLTGAIGSQSAKARRIEDHQRLNAEVEQCAQGFGRWTRLAPNLVRHQLPERSAPEQRSERGWSRCPQGQRSQRS